MVLLRSLSLRLIGFAAALLLFVPAAAHAAVEVSFYSRELGTQFPHGFVKVEGTLDRGGERIETNYGFTATHVSPALLFGSVRGRVEAVGAGYVRGSDAHFTLTVSDSEYDQLMAAVARWQALPQPSYNLNRRNCVHFIADLAAAIGMTAETPRNLMRRPRAFIDSLVRANRPWLDQRGATILREPRDQREDRNDREDREERRSRRGEGSEGA